MDFEKLGRTIFEAITGKQKEEGQTDSTTADVVQDPVIDPKEEIKTETVKIEVDPRDARIKELEDLLRQKDAVIVQNNEQITALKELTSIDQPAGLENLSLEEIIKKGEF